MQEIKYELIKAEEAKKITEDLIKDAPNKAFNEHVERIAESINNAINNYRTELNDITIRKKQLAHRYDELKNKLTNELGYTILERAPESAQGNYVLWSIKW